MQQLIGAVRMKKSIVFLFHAGFWICYFFLALFLTMILMAMIYYSQEEEPDRAMGFIFLTLQFLALFPSVSTFYICYRFLFPKYLQQEKIKRSIFYSIGLAMSLSFVAITLASLAHGTSSNPTDIAASVVFFLLISFVSFLCGIMGLVIRGFITWYEEIKLKQALQAKNQEMELALLKAQLDPHFLFNTLNNIDVLLLRDAQTGSNYLNKLSDIMRFILFETKTKEILLTQEIEYIKKYIALQKIRTANEQYVDFEVIGSADNHMIAPMAFIPFIENAFKHTTNKKLENAIGIHIQVDELGIHLTCRNKFDAHRKPEHSNGLGNQLIEKRLQLLYPDRHTLNITNQNETYQVQLSIQYD
ncbi:MAG: sensor histidine kinase [Bacteroidota bacterium]